MATEPNYDYMLHLRVVEAKCAKMNAYVNVSIIDRYVMTRPSCSDVVKNDKHPVFNKNFHLPLYHPDENSLKIQMINGLIGQNGIVHDQFILPIISIPIGPIFERWYDMIQCCMEESTKIHVQFQITPKSAKPFVNLNEPAFSFVDMYKEKNPNLVAPSMDMMRVVPKDQRPILYVRIIECAKVKPMKAAISLTCLEMGRMPLYVTTKGNKEMVWNEEFQFEMKHPDANSLQLHLVKDGILNVIYGQCVLPLYMIPRDVTFDKWFNFAAVGAHGKAGRIHVLLQVSLPGVQKFTKQSYNLGLTTPLPEALKLFEYVPNSDTLYLYVRVIEAKTAKKQKSIVSLRVNNITSGGNMFFQTKTQPSSNHPQFNETFQFKCKSLKIQNLTVEIVRDAIGPFDPIYSIQVIPISLMDQHVALDKWFDMTPVNGNAEGGKIHLLLQLDSKDVKPFSQEALEAGKNAGFHAVNPTTNQVINVTTMESTPANEQKAIHVKIISAEGIEKQDVYATIAVRTGSARPVFERTKTVKKTSDPVWDETFSFIVQHPATDILCLELMKDIIGPMDLIISKKIIPICSLQEGQLKDELMDLAPANPSVTNQGGKIHVQIILLPIQAKNPFKAQV